MPQCQVDGCLVGSPCNKGEKFTLFSFPKDENLKRQWCSAIGRNPASITSNHRVCARHFVSEDLERKPDSQGRMPKLSKPSATAVPSIHLKKVIN